MPVDMSGRTIMVLVLFLHDGTDGFDRVLVNGVKLSELVL